MFNYYTRIRRMIKMGDKIKVKKINNNLIIILPELINEEDSIYRMYEKIRELLFDKMEKKKYYPHRIHVFFNFRLLKELNLIS